MKIKLISMPFGRLQLPSVALTQLKAVTEEKYGDSAQVDIHYLSIDFAKHIGDVGLYDYPLCPYGYVTGAGDWFFRQAAFPDAPDNKEDYFAKFYFGEDEGQATLREFLGNGRETVPSFLDEMIEKYSLLEADLVGFTMLFSQTTASIALARRLKEKKPEIVIVAGGAVCEETLGWELARQVDCFDAVFSGPGLISFPEFVNCCLENDMKSAAEIRGVFMGDDSDDSEYGAELDINENIILEYDQFLDHLGEAFPEVEPNLLFETSRGCYWAEKMPCSFCGLNGQSHAYRAMTPENAVQHIASLYRYCDRCSIFLAVDNALPKSYIDEALPHINAPSNMKMRYELRTDVEEEDVQKLVAANVTMVQPGIEALSTTSLKLMQKGTTAFQNLKFMKSCSKHPTTVQWTLLIFSPGEPEEVCEKYLHDIPLFSHLPPPDKAFPVMIIRYSKYFHKAQELGMDLKPLDHYGLTFPFDEKAVENIAYHFVDLNYDNINHDKWLNAINEQIVLWHARWFGSDGQPQARLCFEEDDRSHILYDSRNGEIVEWEMSPDDKALLVYLEKPASIDMMMDSSIAKENSFDVKDTLAGLVSKGLVFEENDRYMSLVC